jgi:hypothetical protein
MVLVVVNVIQFKPLVEGRESFWTAVYPLYMRREITRSNIRDVVRKGLEEARGDYKKFLNFLRKHDCQLPSREFR